MNQNTHLDIRMRSFLNDHHILGLATVADNKPYCATMFYAFLEEHNALVINSSDDTQHAANMLSNNQVSGTVALETKIIGKIQGIQFCGEICKIEEFEHQVAARTAYFRRFPYLDLTVSSKCYTGASTSQTLLFYAGCVLIPENILVTFFCLVAPALKGTSEYSILLG